MDKIVLPLIKVKSCDGKWFSFLDVKSYINHGRYNAGRIYSEQIGLYDPDSEVTDDMFVLTLERSSGSETYAFDASRAFVCNGATGSTIDTIS